MKKTPLINSEISAVIAQLGHMDTIVIGDMGLPIPDHVLRIDLAVRMGLPSFQDVLENILTEMHVESFVIAEEASVEFKDLCLSEFQKAQFVVPSSSKVSHEDLKKITENAKVIIRTGEASPYYNVILSSGVTF